MEGSKIYESDFLNVITGKDLDGAQQIRLSYADKDGRTEHRAGVDFVFDSPKSVSICEHVLEYKADEIRTCRQTALKKVCDIISSDYIYYRETKDGVTQKIHAPGAGIIACFEHSTSRENDPHSHIHAIISNMVKTPNGWRALDNEAIFRDQKYLNAVFQSEYAYELAKIGFAIEKKGKGQFEIAGIDESLIKQFSKRHTNIKKLEEDLIVNGTIKNANEAEINRIATLSSRPDKDISITQNELKISWETQINDLGFSKENFQSIGKEKSGEALSHDTLLYLPVQGVVYRTSVNRKKLSADMDWQGGKKDGDIAAARRFAAANWDHKKTERLRDIVGDLKNVLFIAQPSTSLQNLHPIALAERLAIESGGIYASGDFYFNSQHAEASKDISQPERVHNPRDYELHNLEELKEHAKDKKVVVVDDIFTSGGSVAAFIDSLQRAGITVDAHVGYFGDARLRPDPKSIENLEISLRNALIPINGIELAKLLTRQEIGWIIKDINKTRSENAKRELTEKLQRILDRGIARASQYENVSSITKGSSERENIGNERSGTGISLDAGTSKQPGGAGNSEKINPLTSGDYVQFAVQDFTCSESTFSRPEVVRNALSLSIGQLTESHISHAFDTAQKDNTITEIGKDKFNKGIYSTPLMIHAEQQILDLLKTCKNTVSSLMSPDSASSFLSAYETKNNLKLTQGQIDLFTAVMTSSDRFIIAQGNAGAGKTTVFKAIKEAAGQVGFIIEGYSKTGKAVDEFRKVVGAYAVTVDSHLLQRNSNSDHNSKSIRVIDEASTLGSTQTLKEMQLAINDGVRLVIVGDMKQLQSLDAGRIFQECQEKGELPVVQLSKSLRQQTQETDDLVSALSVKDFDRASDALHSYKMITENSDRDQRLATAQNLFLDRGSLKTNTHIITQTNADRIALNDMIRSHFIEQGLIQNECTFKTRDIVNLSETDKRFSYNYSIGSIVFTYEDIKDLENGAVAQVSAVDHLHNSINLTLANGKTVSVNLSIDGAKLQVCNETEKSFAPWDSIVFTKNDYALGVQNGLTGRVIHINDHGEMTVRLSTGREISFSPEDQYPYIDHGYAITTHKSQGATINNVIFLGTAQNTSYNEFYVAASRCKNSFHMVVDNAEDFLNNAQFDALKRSSLDYTYSFDGEEQGTLSHENMNHTVSEFSIIDRLNELDTVMEI